VHVLSFVIEDGRSFSSPFSGRVNIINTNTHAWTDLIVRNNINHLYLMND